MPYRHKTGLRKRYTITPQSEAQLDRRGLPSETLKLRIIRGRGIRGSAEGAVLRIFTPWIITKYTASRGRVSVRQSFRLLSTNFLQRDQPDPGDRISDRH
jgi:hypothetical protein